MREEGGISVSVAPGLATGMFHISMHSKFAPLREYELYRSPIVALTVLTVNVQVKCCIVNKVYFSLHFRQRYKGLEGGRGKILNVSFESF